MPENDEDLKLCIRSCVFDYDGPIDKEAVKILVSYIKSEYC